MWKRILLLHFIAIVAHSVEALGQSHAPVQLSNPISMPAPPQSLPWQAPADGATRCFGFFCRQELQADKKLPMPVRFRLGSMQQNDWLESKPNAQKPDR